MKVESIRKLSAATLAAAVLMGVPAVLGEDAKETKPAQPQQQQAAAPADEAQTAAAISRPMDGKSVEQMIQGWPEKSKKAAMEMIAKYGPPAEATASMLTWKQNGPFKWIKCAKEPVQHDFPIPHPDMLEHAVAYKVPVDKYDDIAMYDGSVIIERTKGEMSARCDQEGHNILSLNLAYDVATGKRTAEEAREEFGKQITMELSGQPAPLTEKLTFQPDTSGGAADPDKPTIQPPPKPQ